MPEAGLTGVAFVLPMPANPAAPRRPPGLPQADAAGRERRGAAARLGVLRPLRGRRHRAAADRQPRGAVRGRPARDGPRGARRPAARLAGPAGRPRPATGSASSSPSTTSGVKALALHDDEMLRLVDQWWPVETNVGPDDAGRVPRPATACCATARPPTSSASSPRSPRPRTSPLINAGYVYDADIIERLPLVDQSIVRGAAGPDRPGHPVRRRSTRRSSWRCGRSSPPPSGRMDPLGCEVVLRSFEPAGLPALYLLDRDAAFRGELRATKEKVDPTLGRRARPRSTRAPGTCGPQLVLNYRNPLVRRITVLPEPGLVGLAVGGALRAGAAARLPPDPAGRRRAAQPVVPRSARPGGARGDQGGGPA